MDDIFRSPRDPSHEYVLSLAPRAELADQPHFDNRLVIAGDGVRTWSPQELVADALRRKPRMDERTTRQIIAAANFRWALEAVDG